MKNGFLHEIRQNYRRWTHTAIALLLVIGLSGLAYGVQVLCINQNDAQVEAKVAGIIYSEELAEAELDELERLTALQPLSVAAKGDLYRAMAGLSYMAGDDMTYNRYVAYAMFYLDKAGQPEAVVDLCNKYIGRLYANGCYASAKQVFADLSRDYHIEELSPQLQASYYLSCADVEQMLEEDSTDNLLKAQNAISRMPEGSEQLLNQAKYDMLTVRDYIQKEDFDNAEKILDAYSEEDDFGLGQDQVYVVCDFKLPYYELMAKCYLQEQNTDAVYSMVQKYVKVCDNYQFRKMKLNLLTYIADYVQSDRQPATNPYSDMEKEAITDNLKEISNEYGRLLLNDIANKKDELAESETHQARSENQVKLVILVLCCSILILCILTTMIDMLGKDGLTGLENRRGYEHKIKELKRKKQPYALLMLDIDDFKLVNDRFGHDCGDTVLSSISDILLRYTGQWTFAYRYGGEELCMIFLHMTEAHVRETGEKIRTEIETQVSTAKMHITISGGLGLSGNGENIFKEADECLYHAKANGKNQIC